MVSLISTMINAVISFFLYILKAFFSMLAWFCKSLFKILKLFFCVLPLTSIAFLLFFILNIILVFKGIPEIEAFTEYEELLEKDAAVSVKLFRDLRIWLVLNIYPTRGSITFILLIILALVMAVPVLFAVLSIGVFMSFGQFLFYAACADIVIYLIRAIFQKSFAAQFQDRYYRLFPNSGKRHYEKNYEKWLRRHHEEFEDDDSRDYLRRSERDFYEDDEYDDDYEYDDYEDESYPDRYEDDYYEDEEYDDDEDYDEDDYEAEYYEDDEDEDMNDSGPSAAFNFFAGCSSRESVDRKYKSLVKLYHPDNMDGDTAALAEINVQYSEAKKKFG